LASFLWTARLLPAAAVQGAEARQAEAEERQRGRLRYVRRGGAITRIDENLLVAGADLRQAEFDLHIVIEPAVESVIKNAAPRHEGSLVDAEVLVDRHRVATFPARAFAQVNQ